MTDEQEPQGAPMDEDDLVASAALHDELEHAMLDGVEAELWQIMEDGVAEARRLKADGRDDGAAFELCRRVFVGIAKCLKEVEDDRQATEADGLETLAIVEGIDIFAADEE